VRFSRPKQAKLAAAAPLLFDCLQRLFYRAEMMHLQIQSLQGFNIETPEALIQAREAIRQVERL
jgi:hypothetical protein